MAFVATTALHKIRKLDKRLKVIQGGSSAGKTIAILLILIDRLQREKGIITSVVSETMPHLKRGAIRDFLNIMETQNYYDDNRWNRSDFTYTFETGSKLEFFSADSPDKVRGPRRNGDLFMNECNNIPYETYTQLAIRTTGSIYLDFNPVQEFWYHEHIAGKADHDFLIITYKDNEGLPQVIIDEIESRRGNKAFWTVYGEGQLGEAEGRIFTGWNTIDEIPHEARLERYGLDFGYTNDPTALIALYYLNGGYILDEVAYQKGLSNKQIADIIAAQPKRALVIADSAEPKSIDEIKAFGITIAPTTKGPGSVLQRIQLMQDQQISVTKRSVNILKEYRNYLWETDKDGRIINEPSPIWNHAMDASGYAFTSLLPMIRRKEMLQSLPRIQRRQRTNIAI
jgi:phage terminase large subunit